MEEEVQTMHDAIHTKYKMFKYDFILQTLTYIPYSDGNFDSTALLLYILNRKFQGVMQVVAMAEILVWIYYVIILSFNEFYILCLDQTLNLLFGFQIFLNMDDSVEIYWLRLLVREWAQFCIFSYIGYVNVNDHTSMRWVF